MPSNDKLAQVAGFDYGLLANSLRKEVFEEANAIRGLLRQTAESLVQIGLRLQVVRNLLGRDHFQGWLKEEFEWSVSTASRYMRVAKKFSHLSCINQFQPTALYLLVQKRVDETVCQTAIERAKNGEIITGAAIEELLNHRQPRDAKAAQTPPTRMRGYVKRLTQDLDENNINELADALMELADELRQRNRQ